MDNLIPLIITVVFAVILVGAVYGIIRRTKSGSIDEETEQKHKNVVRLSQIYFEGDSCKFMGREVTVKHVWWGYAWGEIKVEWMSDTGMYQTATISNNHEKKLVKI